MTRTIKFRAWTGLKMEYDITVGKFGSFYVNAGAKGNGLNETDTASLTPFNTKYDEQVPIMQFTGLLDKNGKEIYEGDVVFSEKLNAHAEVRYGNAHFFIIGGTAAQPLVVAGWELSPNAHGIEIIGDIYTTPELLPLNHPIEG